LTSAQLDVLAKLSDGRAQKQVADELGISDSAVKARLVGARAALNANNTYQAIALAWRYGFLPHKHS
jgi:aldose 1-epimerase/LuxR family transcriptional regulator